MHGAVHIPNLVARCVACSFVAVPPRLPSGDGCAFQRGKGRADKPSDHITCKVHQVFPLINRL